MAKVFLSAEEVVANARTLLLTQTDGVTENFLKQWAYLAQRQIGVTKEHIRTEEIKAIDLAIRKPDDFVKAEDMGLYTASGGELAWIYEARGERVKSSKTLRTSPVWVSEDNHYYHLDSSATGVDCAKLRYFALPLDEQTGEPLIPESHLFATMMFIRYMVATRNSDRDREHFRREWEREAARVRAKNILPDTLQFRNGIVKRYMSMIVSPQSNTF